MPQVKISLTVHNNIKIIDNFHEALFSNSSIHSLRCMYKQLATNNNKQQQQQQQKENNQQQQMTNVYIHQF